jgi:hypothetical protein
LSLPKNYKGSSAWNQVFKGVADFNGKTWDHSLSAIEWVDAIFEQRHQHLIQFLR